MSAGRLAWSAPGGKRPKSPAFQLNFADESALVLTEAGKKKRAKVGLYTPEAIEAELAHLGPDALGLGPERLGEILRANSGRLHAQLRDQRVVAGIGRAWVNEILHRAKLSPYALTKDLSDEEIERLADHDRRDALRRASSCASRESATRRRTASTATWESRAGSAAPRSRRWISRSTRSSTAPRARPAAAC